MPLDDTIQEVNRMMTDKNEFCITVNEQDMVLQVSVIFDLDAHEDSVDPMLKMWPEGWGSYLHDDGRQVVFLTFVYPVHKDSWQIKTLNQVCKAHLNTKPIEQQCDEAFLAKFSSRRMVDLNDPYIDEVLRNSADQMRLNKTKRNGSQETATSAFKTGEGYFLKCPVDAAKDVNLSHRDVRYLVLVQGYCRNKDHCWPSIETLALEMPGVSARERNSRTTVQRALSKLAKHGYIEIIPWHKLQERGYTHVTKANTYRLNYQSK